MDLRAKLPLHIAMLMSALEAQGATCNVGFVANVMSVCCIDPPQNMLETMRHHGFFGADRCYVWLEPNISIMLPADWKIMSMLHDVPLRKR